MIKLKHGTIKEHISSTAARVGGIRIVVSLHCSEEFKELPGMGQNYLVTFSTETGTTEPLDYWDTLANKKTINHPGGKTLTEFFIRNYINGRTFVDDPQRFFSQCRQGGYLAFMSYYRLMTIVSEFDRIGMPESMESSEYRKLMSQYVIEAVLAGRTVKVRDAYGYEESWRLK